MEFGGLASKILRKMLCKNFESLFPKIHILRSKYTLQSQNLLYLFYTFLNSGKQIEPATWLLTNLNAKFLFNVCNLRVRREDVAIFDKKSYVCICGTLKINSENSAFMYQHNTNYDYTYYNS